MSNTSGSDEARRLIDAPADDAAYVEGPPSDAELAAGDSDHTDAGETEAEAYADSLADQIDAATDDDDDEDDDEDDDDDDDDGDDD